MKLLSNDLYINCEDLINEANRLYNIAKTKELHKDDILYITSMNKYINSYDNYKELKIKQYIQDFNEYIYN
jgi:hypothetical protein